MANITGSGGRGEFKPRSSEELAKLDSGGELPTGRTQTLHNELLQRVDQMGFRPEDLKQVPEVVRSLTVADLNDFARKMAGVEQRNPVINRLTIRDIQGIEYLFGSTKEVALTRIAATNVTSLEAVDIDVSCCCCTPCCCCAATEVDPFAA